jgi:hypothetical protein
VLPLFGFDASVTTRTSGPSALGPTLREGAPGTPTREAVREVGREHDRHVGHVAAEERLDVDESGRDGHDPEPAAPGQRPAQPQRLGVRRRVHHGHAHLADVGAQREAEEQHLHERHQEEDGERLAIARHVLHLLAHEGAQRAGGSPAARAWRVGPGHVAHGRLR